MRDHAGLAPAPAPGVHRVSQAEAVAAPHSDIAAQFPGRSIYLDWCLPSPAIPGRSGAAPWRIAFPGPTLARKGAHEVRAAARSLDLEVLLLGAELVGPGFWDGVRTCRPDPAAGRSAGCGT